MMISSFISLSQEGEVREEYGVHMSLSMGPVFCIT